MKVHSFYIEEAEKHGVEKAVILYNLRFWLEKNKANKTNEHDGYYWTYNTAEAFTKLFPYFSKHKVNRLLKQLEADGYVLTGCYNKKGYDRTKWYSLPEFSVKEASSQEDTPFCKNAKCNLQNCEVHFAELQNPFCGSATPIPDINTDSKPDSKPDTYKPEKPEGVSDEIWSDLLITRKKAKATDTKTAWNVIYSQLKKAQQETGHSLDDILTVWIFKGWRGFKCDYYLSEIRKTNTGNNHANNQSANSKPNHFDQLRAEAAAKYGNASTIRTVN